MVGFLGNRGQGACRRFHFGGRCRNLVEGGSDFGAEIGNQGLDLLLAAFLCGAILAGGRFQTRPLDGVVAENLHGAGHGTKFIAPLSVRQVDLGIAFG